MAQVVTFIPTGDERDPALEAAELGGAQEGSFATQQPSALRIEQHNGGVGFFPGRFCVEKFVGDFEEEFLATGGFDFAAHLSGIAPQVGGAPSVALDWFFEETLLRFGVVAVAATMQGLNNVADEIFWGLHG